MYIMGTVYPYRIAQVPAGRPSKYTPEILEKAQAYLDGAYGEMGDVIPTAVGLAEYLGVCESTLRNWMDDPDKPEILGYAKRVQDRQHRLLANKALTGDFNATTAKLLLTKHGYSDKSENTNTHQNPDGSPITLVFNSVG